jgi:DNA-binding CsgD family transcriptional regulator
MQPGEPGGAALARLTANEKECLRRRLLPQTAKEMATDLGISPHAVEKRLKMARAKLGVSSSLVAARLLASAEEDQLLVPHIPDLPNGTNQSHDRDVAGPSAWATSISKGMSMIAAICLIALVGQDAPHPPVPPDTNGMIAIAPKDLASPSSDGVYWREQVRGETALMAQDIIAFNQTDFESSRFHSIFLEQAHLRGLSEAIMFRLEPDGGLRTIATVQPYNQAFKEDVIKRDLHSVTSVGESVSVSYGGSIGAIVRLPVQSTFLYAAYRAARAPE